MGGTSAWGCGPGEGEWLHPDGKDQEENVSRKENLEAQRRQSHLGQGGPRVRKSLVPNSCKLGDVVPRNAYELLLGLSFITQTFLQLHA